MLFTYFWKHFSAIGAPYWLFAIGIFLAVWFIQGKKNIAGPAFIAYLVLVYATAVFSRETRSKYDFNLMPFWSYIQVFTKKNYILLIEIFLNIVMMTPVGFLLPYTERKFNLKKCILATIVIEFFVEFSQLILKKGLFEWDDVINGVIGCCLGYSFYLLIRRIMRD